VTAILKLIDSQSEKRLRMDDFERIVRRIVEGQIKGFVKEHPSVLMGVDWYKPNSDKAEVLKNSIAKRIVRDLTCPATRARLVAALEVVESETASAPKVETGHPASPFDAGPTGTLTGGAGLTPWYNLVRRVFNREQ
jgi:hypothetical protein